MLRSLRMFPLLEGYRGAPPCDVAALEELLLRVSALVEAHPEIAEMDLNPVVALPDGPVAVDARIRLERQPPAPAAARRSPSERPTTARPSPRRADAFRRRGR